ncbi:MAG: oligosaccharide flippase family protein, partial [Erysipelotrichaceae bacterium]|nr:oligosaccharide flippase family protein [Erysipelotrichaceae bacterium]
MKTTGILLVISALSKLLSFLIRIFIARILNSEAIQYYFLTTPVLGFLMTLSQFGIPSALTQMIASRKKAQDTIA